MSRDLPARPSAEHLRKQAKELLQAFQQGDAPAAEQFRSLGAERSTPRLADAQHLVAREYGFATWAALMAHVESLAKPEDAMIALAAAITANDVERARDVIRRHPGIRSRLNEPMPGGAYGATPLLASLPSRNLEMIDLLLGAGADIDQKSYWWAGGFGVLESDRGLATALIARGATVDAVAAAWLGMRDRLGELVSADPGLVHARGGDGHTPLHVAANVDIARYLLDHGADIDALDVDHESTPAQYLLRERPEVARYLVSRGARTDILMAAALGDAALVARHLAADPESIRTRVSPEYFPKRDPRAGGHIYIWVLGWNKTPFSVAREFGHEDVFQLLMTRAPEELNLSQAAELGDEALFKTLLAKRPNLVQTLADDERRQLVDAAQNNNTAAVRLMLSAGWPVDTRGAEGGTALHWASWHGNAEMAREIVKYSPPLEMKDLTHHGTPLGWALHGSERGWHTKDGDHAGVVEALLQAGATAPPLTDELQASEPVRRILQRHARS